MMPRQMFMSIDIQDDALGHEADQEATDAAEPRASFTKRLLTTFSREGSKELQLPTVIFMHHRLVEVESSHLQHTGTRCLSFLNAPVSLAPALE